jgi:phosphatidylserine/phosphatidylglycerophosphate/cardiolipin synthase-like enzyme
MDKGGSVIILLALLIGGAFGYYYGTTSQASQVSQLQSQVDTLTSERNSFETQLTSAQAEIANLTVRIGSLQSEKVIMQAQIDGLVAEKQTLQLKVVQLNSTIQQLNAQIVYLNFLLATANATIESLSTGEPSIPAVRFSPRGGCADQVIYWLGRANSSVHVLIYSFTYDPIGDAVLAAHDRGIEIKIVFEKQQVSQYSEYFRLAAAGIQVRNDTNPNLMHHKVAIIDGHIILIGSFNWSAAGEDDNNEDLLVIRSADLAATLEREFQRIWTTGR